MRNPETAKKLFCKIFGHGGSNIYLCLAPHCECNGRSATCQRHRPRYVTHPRFPPPPSRRCCCPLAPAPPFPARRRFCHCRLLAPPTPRCKGPCLPVPGPIPRAGSLRIALLAVASRRRRCFRCLSRQLTPLPPLLRHRASCRCTHCNSARRQPSRSQALHPCSCLPLCRSLPTRRLLLLPLPTPRRPLLRLVNPVCNIFSIFKVKVSAHSRRHASAG